MYIAYQIQSYDKKFQVEIEPCIIIHVLLEFGLNLVFCFLPASDFDSGGKANKST